MIVLLVGSAPLTPSPRPIGADRRWAISRNVDFFWRGPRQSCFDTASAWVKCLCQSVACSLPGLHGPSPYKSAQRFAASQGAGGQRGLVLLIGACRGGLYEIGARGAFRARRRAGAARLPGTAIFAEAGCSVARRWGRLHSTGRDDPEQFVALSPTSGVRRARFTMRLRFHGASRLVADGLLPDLWIGLGTLALRPRSGGRGTAA